MRFFFFPPLLFTVYERYRSMCLSFLSPQETKAFERRRWKERNGLPEKEGMGPADDDSSRGDRREVFEVFFFFCPFCFRSCLSKKIGEWDWVKGRERHRSTNACGTQAMTRCLMCLMQVPHRKETKWKIVLLSKKNGNFWLSICVLLSLYIYIFFNLINHYFCSETSTGQPWVGKWIC